MKFLVKNWKYAAGFAAGVVTMMAAGYERRQKILDDKMEAFFKEVQEKCDEAES